MLTDNQLKHYHEDGFLILHNSDNDYLQPVRDEVATVDEVAKPTPCGRKNP